MSLGAWTVRDKLVGLSLVGLAAVVATGAAADWGLRWLAGAMDAVAVNSNIQRNHVTADMLHEGLRADVLAAFVAGLRNDQAEGTRALGGQPGNADTGHIARSPHDPAPSSTRR